MNHSTFIWRKDKNKSFGYDVNSFLVENSIEMFPEIVLKIQQSDTSVKKEIIPIAAFTLHTTSLDYVKFVIAILNDSGLQSKSIREMLKPQVQLQECLNCIDQNPTRQSDSLFWGLGWGLQRTDKGESFWHWGG